MISNHQISMFCFGKGCGNFFKMATQPHQLFSLFSNSDRCQVMATMALGNCQKCCRFIPLPWPKSWLLGSCPGAWATTAVDIRTNFGNYQGFMYDHSSYWWHRRSDASSPLEAPQSRCSGALPHRSATQRTAAAPPVAAALIHETWAVAI